MKSYYLDLFDAYELVSLDIANALIGGVESLDHEGRQVRCHELARAVITFLGAHWTSGAPRVVDGSYMGWIQHSWIRFSSGNVLDVYVPGRHPHVQLVGGDHPTARTTYRIGEDRSDIRTDVLERLVIAMRKVVAS